MNNDHRLFADSPLYEEARALELAVRTLRRARGKQNPQDVPHGSPQWHLVCDAFARDVYRAIGGDPDQLTADIAAGKASPGSSS
ncbi:hypothetical protein AAGS40_19835 [Paraburkholderia sp. PREW-6R]|uniref:hypothetical protein n=1 Tax=Paraburkholderia sp. PREW-6R TaxID=3141544 RepID=UPI0031F4F331